MLFLQVFQDFGSFWLYFAFWFHYHVHFSADCWRLLLHSWIVRLAKWKKWSLTAKAKNLNTQKSLKKGREQSDYQWQQYIESEWMDVWISRERINLGLWWENFNYFNEFCIFSWYFLVSANNWKFEGNIYVLFVILQLS